MPPTLRKWLIPPAVGLLVVLACRSGILTKAPVRRVAIAPPSPLMAELQSEIFAIRNLFRNATSTHRNRKKIARLCAHLHELARTLRDRPQAQHRPSVSPERWRTLSEDLAGSAKSLERLVRSSPEPSLAAIRGSYARIVHTCVQCHRETYLRP